MTIPTFVATLCVLANRPIFAIFYAKWKTPDFSRFPQSHVSHVRELKAHPLPSAVCGIESHVSRVRALKSDGSTSRPRQNKVARLGVRELKFVRIHAHNSPRVSHVSYVRELNRISSRATHTEGLRDSDILANG